MNIEKVTTDNTITSSLLDERIAVYIQENNKEILDILTGNRFWERFWPEGALKIISSNNVHSDNTDSKKLPAQFKASFNASIDPISGKGDIINLNDGTIESIFNKIRNKEPVSYKDIATIHLVMSSFELELNKKVRTFFMSKDEWEKIFDEHVHSELNSLLISSMGTNLTAIKILTVCYPEKMEKLIESHDKIFVIKPKFGLRIKVDPDVTGDALAIVENIVRDYKSKLITMSGTDLDQTSEQYLKDLDSMLLELNEGTKNPHIKSTQQLFAILANNETFFEAISSIASRSSIYGGQSPTIFADNRKPPVIGAVISAVKAVYEKYSILENMEEDLTKWSTLSGFAALGEEGKAVIIRSIVEDFDELDYKQVIKFYKNMGGNPYVPIPPHFDRSEKPVKASPFSPTQKKEIQLSHWLYDRISSKIEDTTVNPKKNTNKVFKTLK